MPGLIARPTPEKTSQRLEGWNGKEVERGQVFMFGRQREVIDVSGRQPGNGKTTSNSQVPILHLQYNS